LMFGNVNFDGAGGNTFGLVTEPALSQSGRMTKGVMSYGFLFKCHVQRWRIAV
jgi:hypothetical protein